MKKCLANGRLVSLYARRSTNIEFCEHLERNTLLLTYILKDSDCAALRTVRGPGGVKDTGCLHRQATRRRFVFLSAKEAVHCTGGVNPFSFLAFPVVAWSSCAIE